MKTFISIALLLFLPISTFAEGSKPNIPMIAVDDLNDWAYGNSENMLQSEPVKTHATLPEYFSKHGYKTISSGKIFHKHETENGSAICRTSLARYLSDTNQEILIFPYFHFLCVRSQFTSRFFGRG